MPTNTKKISKNPADIKSSSITVGANVNINGEISNAKEVSIDGIADIKVTTEKIIIGEKGHVAGQIVAADAQVKGDLSGDITVSNTLTIHDKGSVSGKIAYRMLDIKLGGMIKGDISAIDESPKPQAKAVDISPTSNSLSKKDDKPASIMDLADKIAEKK
jgi:cytoskeletal protein CcmA (bactofilin family)